MWVRKQGSRVTAVVCYTVQDWACFVRRLQNLRRHLFAPTKDQITKRIGFGSRIGTIRIHALEPGRTHGRRARVEANVRMIRNRKKYLKFDCKITALQLVFFPRTARSIPSKVFGERIQLDRDKRAYLPWSQIWFGSALFAEVTSSTSSTTTSWYLSTTTTLSWYKL